MTRSELQAIWQAATGLRFAPGSATERGLIAVLDAAAQKIYDSSWSEEGLLLSGIVQFKTDTGRK